MQMQRHSASIGNRAHLIDSRTVPCRPKKEVEQVATQRRFLHRWSSVEAIEANINADPMPTPICAVGNWWAQVAKRNWSMMATSPTVVRLLPLSRASDLVFRHAATVPATTSQQ